MLPFLYSNVPELGAPHVGNWNDVPVPEKPFLLRDRSALPA